jgi:uridine kinase
MMLKPIIEPILAKHEKMPRNQSLLVGISGIDASGKGFITAKLAEAIESRGFKVANINIDGWLNLPNIRFDKNNLAENFYKKAIRFEEMFKKLILPLRENRSIKLTGDFAEETAAKFRKHEYFYEEIDIILLEGIFLFKNDLVEYFDLKIWIECSFEMALQRAIARSQENLSPAETVKAYQTIYFPAQKIHFAEDNPLEKAHLIFSNDFNL